MDTASYYHNYYIAVHGCPILIQSATEPKLLYTHNSFANFTTGLATVRGFVGEEGGGVGSRWRIKKYIRAIFFAF